MSFYFKYTVALLFTGLVSQMALAESGFTPVTCTTHDTPGFTNLINLLDQKALTNPPAEKGDHHQGLSRIDKCTSDFKSVYTKFCLPPDKLRLCSDAYKDPELSITDSDNKWKNIAQKVVHEKKLAARANDCATFFSQSKNVCLEEMRKTLQSDRCVLAKSSLNQFKRHLGNYVKTQTKKYCKMVNNQNYFRYLETKAKQESAKIYNNLLDKTPPARDLGSDPAG